MPRPLLEKAVGILSKLGALDPAALLCGWLNRLKDIADLQFSGAIKAAHDDAKRAFIEIETNAADAVVSRLATVAEIIQRAAVKLRTCTRALGARR